MTLVIEDLFTQPAHVATVASWIYNEFWADKSIHTPESLEQLLRRANPEDAIPISLLALVDGNPVGTVNLVENDDDDRAYVRPWLAALFVEPNKRRRGIGFALVRNLQERASGMGSDAMFLGTDNPGFYSRLGAQIHEQVSENFCIMRLVCKHSNRSHAIRR